MWPPKVEDKEELNQYLASRDFVSNKNDKISEIENNMSNFLETKYFSFFDSDENNVIELLKKFKRVKAIIAVHMQGYPCNLNFMIQIN